jgi:hypothetical protein
MIETETNLDSQARYYLIQDLSTLQNCWIGYTINIQAGVLGMTPRTI